MKRMLKAACALFALPVVANMNPKIGFVDYPNYYFVETGTYDGDGIRFALKGNYQEIHSVEIFDDFVNRARINFARYPQVRIWKGDSGKMLYDVIKNMDKPITFWLDGHNGTPSKDGSKNTPLMEELDQIKQHHIKTHTIIIDDMHCCGTILFDYLTREDIIAKIKEINDDYVISYIPGGNEGEYPNNIMIAQVAQ